jgi:uncharacterized protein (UPF0297 family)
MKRRAALVVTVLILMLPLSCKTTKKEIIESQVPRPKKIAILYHYTTFRETVIDSLVKQLSTTSLVTVDNAYRSRDYNPEEYDLIIVFSGIHALIPDAAPRVVIRRFKRKTRVIHVFCTYYSKKGVTVTKGGVGKVDTITAASVDKNISPLTRTLYKVVRDKLAEERGSR